MDDAPLPLARPPRAYLPAKDAMPAPMDSISPPSPVGASSLKPVGSDPIRTEREEAELVSACAGTGAGVSSAMSATALTGALVAGADENDSLDIDVSPALVSVFAVAATVTRPLKTFSTASAPTEVSTAALEGQKVT